MAKAFTVASIDTCSDHALLFSQLEKVWTPSAWAFMPHQISVSLTRTEMIDASTPSVRAAPAVGNGGLVFGWPHEGEDRDPRGSWD